MYSYTERQGEDFSPDGSKVFLTVGSPAATLIIDIATGELIGTRDLG